MLRTTPLLKAGFSIKVNNGKLIIRPKEKLTKQTRLYIDAFKQEIINELTLLHEKEPVTIIEDRAEPTKQAKTNPCFNTFINHLMRSRGTCCYAPANRYCDMGRALKTKYEGSDNTS